MPQGLTMKRIASLLLSTLAVSNAFADEWHMQGEGELLFQPTWEGEVLPGRFGAFDVRLDTGDDGLAGAELEVTVELGSADMDDPDINEAIAGAEWFAVSEHPVATYTSDSIEKTADGAYLASGHLELKGARLPVDVPFRWSAKGGRAAMSGEVVIDRTRFEVGSGDWGSGETIGTEVRVSFDVILERQ
jgi:polyisoprenoid-binding protein YceI